MLNFKTFPINHVSISNETYENNLNIECVKIILYFTEFFKVISSNKVQEYFF